MGNLTPQQEIDEINRLEAEEAEIEEINRLEFELNQPDQPPIEQYEPNMADRAGDWGSEAIHSLGKTAQSMFRTATDVTPNIGSPIYGRLGKGIDNLRDDNPETGFWGGFGEKQTNTLADKLEGATNSALSRVKAMQRIPEGYDNLTDKGRTFTKHAAPIAAGGGALNALGKTKAAALMAHDAIGSGLGGAIGSEYGKRGEAYGSALGGIASDPKGVMDGAIALKDLAVGGWDKISRWGQKADLSNATNEEKRQAVALIAGEEYDAKTFGKKNNEGVKQFYDKVEQGVKAGDNGTLGSMTNNQGIMNFENAADTREFRAGKSRIDAKFNEVGLDAFDDVSKHYESGGLSGRAEDASGAVNARMMKAKALRESRANAQAEAGNRVAETNYSNALRNEKNSEVLFDIEAQSSASPYGSTIMEGGGKGAARLSDEFNAKYAEGWGLAGDINPKVSASMKDTLKSNMKFFGKDMQGDLKAVIREIDKLTTADGGSAALARLDRIIGDVKYKNINDRSFNNLLTDVRGELRDSLPKAAKTIIDHADSKYGEFLSIVKTTGKDGQLGGVLKPANLSSSSKVIFGEKAVGTQRSPNYAMIEKGENARQASVNATATAKQGVADAKLIGNKKIQSAADANKKMMDSKVAKFGSAEQNEYYKAVEPYIANLTSKTGSATPIKDLKRLLSSAQNPTEKANIQSALIRSLKESHRNKDGFIAMDSIKKFNRERVALEKSGVMTKSQLDHIAYGLEESNKMYMHLTTKQLSKIPEERKRVAEGVAALFGAKVGSFAFGSPLIGAALGRKAATDIYANLTREKIRKLAYELTANPDKFVDVVKSLDKGNITVRSWKQTFEELTVRAGVSTASGFDKAEED